MFQEISTEMKNLLYISLILSGIVTINELAYLGETSLAYVILALAIAVGLQAIYLIRK